MDLSTKGKLIVIEGGDGSGKGTQSQLLLEYFKTNNIPHMFLDFPQYDSFFGQMIGNFLRGDYGSLEQVSPYLASLLFALDRNAMKDQIQQALQEGKIILANRYVSSNIAHQGGRFNNDEEKERFTTWLKKLEFEIHGIPREDLVIYLQVPWQTAQKLTTQKEERKYLQGNKEDIQEKDINHRMDAEKMYEYLARTNDSWITIPCVEHDTIISKDAIHEKIVTILQKQNII